MAMSPVPFIILAVLGVGIYAWYSDKKRKEALAAWALSKGWRVRPGKLKGLDREYPGLKFFDKGHSRSASNVITGQYKGRTIRLMDYKYVTGSGKNRTTHKLGVALIQTDYPMIPLTIRRENPFDKLGEFLGADDIDFESAEFSRKFYVKSNDRKWAYDVIHQRAMDYLLASPSYSIAFGFQEIAVTKRGHFGPDNYEEALDLAVGLYDLIPEYVIQQMKGQSR
jgi:hypothetical protein